MTFNSFSRVALQWEFSALGLDDCLDRLRRRHESEELSVQISAYVDNEFDVSALMEEAEAKAAAIDRVHELEEEVQYGCQCYFSVRAKRTTSSLLAAL